MEKGNCGDVEVAHICSKTCNVLACNQQVRRNLFLIQRPHTPTLFPGFSPTRREGRREPWERVSPHP